MTQATERLNRLPAAERGITIGDFLVPVAVGERLGTRTRHVALVIAGAILIALTANLQVVLQGQTILLPGDVRVTLPTSPVPITRADVLGAPRRWRTRVPSRHPGGLAVPGHGPPAAGLRGQRVRPRHVPCA